MPRIARRFKDSGLCSRGSHNILPGPGAPVLQVFVEDMPVAVQGDLIMPHSENEHMVSVILSGWPTVFVNDIPVATLGMPILCGGAVVSTTSGVFAGPPA
jgi:uncharacterized Zn-binding protein involved in type VI secretion